MATREQMAERYTGKDNYGHPKTDYVAQIEAMTDGELLEEAEKKIWLSAFAGNNPRSDFHWQVDVIYDECSIRNKVDEIYVKGYNRAKRSCGLT